MSARSIAAIALCWGLVAASGCADTMTPVGASSRITLCSARSPLGKDLEDYWCGMLAALHEPGMPITNPGQTVEAFRLLYVRSFHALIVVRIEIRSASDAILAAKEIPRSDKEKSLDRTVNLVSSDIAEFRALIVRDDFWNAPSQYNVDVDIGPFATPIREGQHVIMSDGAMWIIEGIDATHYKVMGDDGGAFESPVRDVGLLMLNLAKKHMPTLDIDPIY